MAAGLVEFDVGGLGEKLEHLLLKLDPVAHVSVHVRDLDSQHVLFDYSGNTPLNPASNQKIVTSSAALDLLGADYTFATKVLRSDKDLILLGEGDPTLSVEDLQALGTSVVEQVDLAEIERLVVDDTAFSRDRFGPGYSETGPGYAYEAPSGALSLAFNTVMVTVAPVKGQRALDVQIDPPGAHLVVDNTATVGSRRKLWVSTAEKGDHTMVEVSGTVRRNSRPVSVRRRVTDPGLYTGTVFAEILGELTTSQPLAVGRGRVPADADPLIVHESVPLIEILDSGLAYSNNFIAEQVLRTVAWRMTGDPGDWHAGQEILYGYWSALGGRTDSLVVENASGLSRQGRVTAAGLVDLISVAHRIHQDEGSLIDALPVAGEPGTLRSRLRLSGKRVRAKTGTLKGVSGLTGVITSEGGTPRLAFSILTNVAEEQILSAARRRRVEDNIVMAVLHALDDYEAQRVGIAAPRGLGTP
jgi:D-alanyl-D-alanine carboxypeptidase/D-alanyl-D-alanine-endopeptidase (penicillin-binding protein 4)